MDEIEKVGDKYRLRRHVERGHTWKTTMAKFASVWVGVALVAAAAASLVCPLETFTEDAVLTTEKVDPSNLNMGHYTRVHGNTIIAGAYGYDDWRGTVNVWTLDEVTEEWNFKQSLIPSVQEPFAYFGLNIDIWGDTIVAGAPYEEPNGFKSGAVYVFQKQLDGMFSETARIVPWDSQTSGYFGYAVAIQENRLVIGARFTKNEIDNIRRAGKIYVYERTSSASTEWTLSGQMRGSKKSVHWADEVRVEGDVILAGAPRDFGGEGAAYVFHKVEGSWTEMQTLRVIGDETNPPQNSDHFGEGITISTDGTYLVVAGERRSFSGSSSGAGQLYNLVNGEWVFHQHITPPRGGNLRFGQRVVADGDVLIVGAWTSPLQAAGAGEVFVYSRCSDGEFRLMTNIVKVNAEINENFGKMVDVSGNYLVVGAPKTTEGAFSDAGSVSVYKIDEVTGGYTIEPTPVPETVEFSPEPTEFVAGAVNEFTVAYSGNETRWISVRVRESINTANKYLQKNYAVDAGEGTITISVTIPDTVGSGTELEVRVGIVPVNGAWKDRFDSVFAYPNVI